MSFWGLRVTSGKSYKQTVLKDYKVTQAVLDINTVTSNEIISLQVDVNGSSFLLCNLSLDHGILQVPLECPFSEGEVVTFLIWSNSESEKAVVHLTGYIKDSSPSAKVSNGECPLTNVTNIKAKNLKSSINRIHKNEYSVHKDKENESPEENKQTNSISEDKKTSQKNKKKSKSDKKEVSLKDMLNTINVDDEDDEDEEYSPEEEEAENEMLDEDDEDDTDDEEEEEEEDDDDDDDDEDTDEDLEKEITLEEEEENDDDQINNTVEIEDMEEDLKDEEEDEILKDLPKKKKRRLSSSSAGRTPIPKSSKKPKIQDVSGSPVLTETSAKKKKSQKLTLSDSTSVNKNVSLIKTPKDSEKKKESKDSSDEKSDASPSSASKGKKRISMGGVILEDLVIGTGATAVKGKKVSVYYEGKLKNGKVFDKIKSGGCFKFKLGANDVIKAWEIGVVGMQVGGKRKITAPPGMAYGKSGAPPKIPPNAVLTFEIELKGVN